MEEKNTSEKKLLKIIQHLLLLIAVLVFFLLAMPIVIVNSSSWLQLFSGNAPTSFPKGEKEISMNSAHNKYWKAPEINSVTDSLKLKQILYGKELIVHTSSYFGPEGSINQQSNGMNCQNCHLDAGTKIYGNNYSSVASTYPKLRARSGTMENIYKRVNDCFERSLNGKSLDTMSNEMNAITAYIQFLGSNVEKGKKAEGAGFKELAFLDRASDPEVGKVIYRAKCQSCHSANGEGVLLDSKKEYQYPPLWGANSYNDGAGLYRISNFAKYIKCNMPLGATYENPQLSDEEAWDLAAFVNSQNRPHYSAKNDWPDISKKPVDHPYGPYADHFTSTQHKYGPFLPIQEVQKKNQSTSKH